MTKMYISDEERDQIRALLGEEPVAATEEPTTATAAIDISYERRLEHMRRVLDMLDRLSTVEPLYADISARMKQSLRDNPMEVIRFITVAYALFLNPKDVARLLDLLVRDMTKRGHENHTAPDEFLVDMLTEYNKLTLDAMAENPNLRVTIIGGKDEEKGEDHEIVGSEDERG